ncbi:MAG: diacylglycerol/lipid kinase family protein [Stellaceae bacterium]
MPPSTSRRVLVIFNPTAGAQRGRKLDRVLNELKRLGCVVTLRATQARGDAESIARGADRASFDVVAVAGGDGTVNEAINGLADGLLPFAVIPLGTANVLANEIGLSLSDAARIIARATPRMIYLGQANGRRFVMMIGIGIDARIVEGIDPRLKRASGKFAYVWSGIRSIAQYRPTTYRFIIDGNPHQAAGAIVAKGHFYGGRFVVAPDARLDRPTLHAVLLGRPGRWNIVRYGLAIAMKRIDRLPDVRVIEAKSVRVEGVDGEAAQADGDLAAALPLDISVAEKRLLLVRP